MLGTGVLLVLAALGWFAYGALRVRGSVDDAAAFWAEAARQDGELVYVALGDSAAQGIGASAPERGYVGILAERLRAETGRTVRVVNLSVSGARATDVVAVQLDQLAALRTAGPAGGDAVTDLVTVDIGGNDAGRTDPDAFRRSFTAICDALPEGAYVADVPDFGGGPRRPAAARLAAIAREVLAEREDLRLVHLERATLEMSWGDYAADFFHPGDSGYRIWADAYWQAITPDLDGLSRR